MELVYTDASLNDLGYLRAFELDLEDGPSKHDFQLKLPKSEFSKLEKGSYIYVDARNGAARFGGKATSFKTSSFSDIVSISGLTWIGLLNTRVLYLPYGSDPYYRPKRYLMGYRPDQLLNNVILPESKLNDFCSGPSSAVGTSRDWLLNVPATVLELMDQELVTSTSYYSCSFDRLSKRLKLDITTSKHVLIDSLDPAVQSFEITKNEFPITHVIAVGRMDSENYNLAHSLLRRPEAARYQRDIDIETMTSYEYEHRTIGNYYTDREETVAYIQAEDSDNAFVGLEQKHLQMLENQSSSLIVGDVGADLGDYVKCIDRDSGITAEKRLTSCVLKMTETSFDVSYS